MPIPKADKKTQLMRWRWSTPFSFCFWNVSTPSKPMMIGDLPLTVKKPSLDNRFAVAMGQNGWKKC